MVCVLEFNFSFTCLYILISVLWCRYDFRIKTMLGSSVSPLVCKLAHVLITLSRFVYVQWFPTHILLCFCVPCMEIQISLDCPFLIAGLFLSSITDKLFPDLTIYIYIWVTRQRVSYKNNKLLTLREHLGSPMVFCVYCLFCYCFFGFH